MTMLAVVRLADRAFGAAIQEELERVARRSVSVSTIYVTLVRLEDQGLVESDRLPPEAGKGGPGKRVFRVTASGLEALEEARAAMARLWEGLAGT